MTNVMSYKKSCGLFVVALLAFVLCTSAAIAAETTVSLKTDVGVQAQQVTKAVTDGLKELTKQAEGMGVKVQPIVEHQIYLHTRCYVSYGVIFAVIGALLLLGAFGRYKKFRLLIEKSEKCAIDNPPEKNDYGEYRNVHPMIRIYSERAAIERLSCYVWLLWGLLFCAVGAYNLCNAELLGTLSFIHLFIH